MRGLVGIELSPPNICRRHRLHPQIPQFARMLVVFVLLVSHFLIVLLSPLGGNTTYNIWPTTLSHEQSV